MGILANFNNDSKREALTKIVKAVQTNSKKGFKENITFKHLRILAQIPNFESLIVEIMETLDKYFKEERDPLYMRGVEKKNHEVVMNLLSANKFTDEEIAAFAGVYLSYVQKVRKELKNKTN